MHTARSIAERIGARCDGPDRDLVGVASLENAGPTDLSFCTGGRYLRMLATTAAGAVVVREGQAVPEGCTALRHANPRLAYARAASAMLPLTWPEPGVHALACVDPTASVEGATIGPFAVIGANVTVSAGAWVQAHAYVGAGAFIGESARVMPHAVVMDGCTIGKRVWLEPGAVIGADGFGHVVGPEGVLRVPQLGTVILEDDVEVGANACIDRAALDETRVGVGSRIDNLVQIAHGARIGAQCLIAAFAGVAGGARLGDRVVMAGRTAVIDGIEVGDDVVFAALASASRNVASGTRLGGSPARRYRVWLREVAAVRQLPEALRVLERLRRAHEEDENGS